MADISDQTDKTTAAESPCCSGKLLEDSFTAPKAAALSAMPIDNQTLAFDSDIKRLDFGTGSSNSLNGGKPDIGNLRFDTKFSATLLFDVNVKS
jgi:hypothetical protein